MFIKSLGACFITILQKYVVRYKDRGRGIQGQARVFIFIPGQGQALAWSPLHLNCPWSPRPGQGLGKTLAPRPGQGLAHKTLARPGVTVKNFLKIDFSYIFFFFL